MFDDQVVPYEKDWYQVLNCSSEWLPRAGWVFEPKTWLVDMKYKPWAMNPKAPVILQDNHGKRKQAVMSESAKYMIFHGKLICQLYMLISEFNFEWPKLIVASISVVVTWFNTTSFIQVWVEELKMTQYLPYFSRIPCGLCGAAKVRWKENDPWSEG
jgi:hypothetical protein